MTRKPKGFIEKNIAEVIISKEYAQVFSSIKKEILSAQIKASFSVNKELIKLYWWIGKIIALQQDLEGWGAGVIENLAKDLQNALPGIGGFSRANIFYMRAFYRAYEIVQTPSGQFDDLPVFNIPWWHNIILITKLKDNNQRLWYAQKSLEFGWSGNILESWITSDLYQREGKAITNFSRTLPAPHSDMAHQALKDPYFLDFLTLRKEHLEKELEQGLINHIQKFLLELGQGFAFVGRQVHLRVGPKDYYIDLLFYHYKLRCFIVVELKAAPFDPRDAGQINFYLSAVDDLMRSPDDKPSMGLILCKSKDNFTAEYALRDINKPIGVASYETILVEDLPINLKGSLPTIEEIEMALEKQEILAEVEEENSKS